MSEQVFKKWMYLPGVDDPSERIHRRRATRGNERARILRSIMERGAQP